MPCTVQNGAELGAPGDEYNKSPCREGSPILLKDKTHHPTSPSGIFSCLLPISMRMIGSWGRIDSRAYSQLVSFVFEQSGAPLPALVVLVTRCPELSAIFNCTGHKCNGFVSTFLVG